MRGELREGCADSRHRTSADGAFRESNFCCFDLNDGEDWFGDRRPFLAGCKGALRVCKKI